MSASYEVADKEAEEIVALNLLAYPELAPRVFRRIDAEVFHYPLPREVYKSLRELYNGGVDHPSIELVIKHMKERGVLERCGGRDEIFAKRKDRLQEEADDVVYHAKRVMAYRRLRDQNKVMDEAATMQEDATVRLKDKIQGTRKAIEQLLALEAETAGTGGWQSEIREDVFDRSRQARDGELDIVCPTGFISLDRVITGLPRSRVTVVGARTSHGKTAFATQLSVQVANRFRMSGEGQVVYISCEMNKVAMSRRIIANRGRVNPTDIRDGNLSDEQLARLERLPEVPIYIDTHPAPTTEYMMSLVAAQNIRKPVELLVFDYLDYTGESGERQEALDRAIIGSHRVAKRFDIPVVCLHQLSRNMDQRPEGEPRLSDLSWSSDVEKKAQLVLLLYHPYTHSMQINREHEGDEREFIIRVAKNTEGSTSRMVIEFITETVHFEDPQNRQYNEGDTPF